MTVIVDASVALKWVVAEKGSDAARTLLKNETLAAPDLLLVECANVLWVMARSKQLSSMDATAAFAAIQGAPVRSVPSRQHIEGALRIAFELDQPVYDCLYLTVALAERATFVTADMAFLKAVASNANYTTAVRPLTA